MITSLYKGKEELTINQYEALSSIDPDIDYTITNYPTTSITNSQMVLALNCTRLFNAGETFICSDNGTYKKGAIYEITVDNGVKSWTEISSNIIINTTAPTTSTVGVVGQFYLNTTDSKLYQCTAITSGTPDIYTWTEVGGGMEVLTGNSDPTTSTVGELGQIYIATTTLGVLIYQCYKIDSSNYYWSNIGGGGNNTSTYISAGGSIAGSATNSIAIGGQILSSQGVAIGKKSGTVNSGNTAVGYNAKANGAYNCIQLGAGTNTTGYTLQIFDDNIYNHSTHTLTVQNATVNSNQVYGTLTGASAPTTTTVGSVGQFYVETTTPALYLCTAITEDTSTTPSTFTYTWNKVSNDKIYLHDLCISLAWPRRKNIRCQIFSNDNTPIDTKLKLATWLYSNNYNSLNNQYPATGYRIQGDGNTGITDLPTGFFSENGTQLKYTYVDIKNTSTQIMINNVNNTLITDAKLNITSISDPNMSFADNVVQL